MRRRGRVAEYDEHKGYGFIETADGRRLFFHCTAIAGGSRSVPAGAEVEYVEVTDPRGKPEASDVTTTSPAAGVTPSEHRPPPSSSARTPSEAG